MPNIKWTAAELAIWNILLIAVGAAITGGAPALLEYMAGTNVDVTLVLKLALAGAIGSFVASISTYFRKNSGATSTLLQAIMDALGQVQAAVTTPQPVATPPQPIVLPVIPGTAIINQRTVPPADNTPSYVPPVFAQPMQPFNATATAAPPTYVQPWVPPASDFHAGDTGLVPVIPKQ